MSKQVQFRRGTTAEHSTFTGAVGEITVDTTRSAPVVHDGATAGGYPIAKVSELPGSNPQFTTIELGHASDTTLSRSSAGVVAVEGVTLARNSTSASHTASTIELGHASDTTLSRSSAGNLAVEGNVVYRAGGTDVPLADGGTGASLTDPNADRIMFWDDSAGAVTWLEAGTGLTISGTTMTASGAAWSTGSGTLTSGSTLDIAIPSTANEFFLTFEGISCDTGSRALYIRALTAAATPDTTAGNYQGTTCETAGGTITAISAATFTPTVSQGSGDVISGWITITGMAMGVGRPVASVSGWYSGSGTTRGLTISYWDNASQLYGIRLMWSGSGSFDATGTGAYVYGSR